jgi:hypothetical protein
MLCAYLQQEKSLIIRVFGAVTPAYTGKNSSLPSPLFTNFGGWGQYGQDLH